MLAVLAGVAAVVFLGILGAVIGVGVICSMVVGFFKS